MFHTLQTLTPRTSTSSPFPEPVFQHSEQPCADLRPHLSGAFGWAAIVHKVMSLSSLLNTRITGISPKTTSSPNHEDFSCQTPVLRANVAKSLLDGNRDHLLTHARSELMKQEHRVESLNNCINELQQKACALRLDLKNTHHGYVESRREQVRLQQELVMKEKSSSRYSD